MEYKLKIGMLLFPELTLQDFVGPYDVFIKAGCFEIFIVSENTDLLHAEGGLKLKADISFADCPALDIIFVPGGRGITRLLKDQAYIDFVRRQGMHAKFITSVCTGSLLLGVAGLLMGYKATTHWRSVPLLKMLNVETVEDRVVIDRNRITGGGVTAGIDFALTLTSMIAGEERAKIIQLLLEYDPSPPFNSGSPKHADKDIIEKAIQASENVFNQRIKIIQNSLLQSK